MLEEENKLPQGEVDPKSVSEETEDPATIIMNLKKTTVSKEEYDALNKKYKSTLKAIADGDKIMVEPEHTLTADERKKRISELRKEVINRDGSLSNLSFWEKSLELRQLLLDEGKPDMFSGRGRSTPKDDINQSDEISKAIDVIQSCIDKAEGNNAVFTAMLQEKLEDDPALALKMLAKKRSSR